MRNISPEEFEKLLAAIVLAANAVDPNIEEGLRIGQDWSPSAVEVKLRYAADVAKLTDWLRTNSFKRKVIVVKVPCKIGHELYWKDILAQVLDNGEYRNPPDKYTLKKGVK